MLPAAINKKSSKKNPNRLISIVHSSSVFVHTALSVSPRKYTCTHARRAYKYTGAMSVYLYTRVPVAWLLLLVLTRVTEKTTTFCFFPMIHSLSWRWRFSSSAWKNRTCLPMTRLLINPIALIITSSMPRKLGVFKNVRFKFHFYVVLLLTLRKYY